MFHISLFSGIGGFDLAAQWAGWTNIVSCEINPFGRKHLEYYWPDAYHHDDIHTLNIQRINEQLTKRFGADWRTDDIVLTGGFPCQPYSLAGKRLGKEDDRHLWPEMLRVIREVRPTYIVGENVFGLVNWSNGLVFNEVQTDLEAEGYEVQSFVLPACATNAPHRRDRLWVVAYCTNQKQRKQTIKRIRPEFRNGAWIAENTMRSGCLCGEPNKEGTKNGEQRNACAGNCNGLCLSERIITNAANIGQEQPRNAREWRSGFADCDSNAGRNATYANGIGQPGEKHGHQESGFNCENRKGISWHNFPTQSPVCPRNDGLPAELDGITFPKWRNESIKAAGNAVVPQVVLKIFEAINAIQTIHNTNTHNT